MESAEAPAGHTKSAAMVTAAGTQGDEIGRNAVPRDRAAWTASVRGPPRGDAPLTGLAHRG